jgi:hypothetical protein
MIHCTFVLLTESSSHQSLSHHWAFHHLPNYSSCKPSDATVTTTATIGLSGVVHEPMCLGLAAGLQAPVPNGMSPCS